MIKRQFFDSEFDVLEQIPRKFTVHFESIKVESENKTKVYINGKQVGDVIDDNSRISDSYRFHDVFHYTFAAMLGWSPCTRAMMKRKRKSDVLMDRVEDGARASITEESISLIIFNKAKQKGYFDNTHKISNVLLNQIMEMTDNLEVVIRSKKEWEKAILIGYSLFRKLIKNNGGIIHFDLLNRSAIYEKI